MVFDKMTAICLNFKWLGFWISVVIVFEGLLRDILLFAKW